MSNHYMMVTLRTYLTLMKNRCFVALSGQCSRRTRCSNVSGLSPLVGRNNQKEKKNRFVNVFQCLCNVAKMSSECSNCS